MTSRMQNIGCGNFSCVCMYGLGGSSGWCCYWGIEGDAMIVAMCATSISGGGSLLDEIVAAAAAAGGGWR